jgi:heptosyltransferase-2
MTDPILVIQTAFAGDLVLTTPLIEETALMHPGAPIDVLCIPSTAALLYGNPFIRRCIVYDKHRRSPSLPALMRQLAGEKYGLCLCPHRSLRSAMLARATGAGRRIAFDRSAGRPLFTETVVYRQSWHEVDRNRALLAGGGSPQPVERRPRLYPSADDRSAAEQLLAGSDARPYLCIAPGSVWATKRWTEEGFAAVTRHFRRSHRIILLGSAEDRPLCERIIQLAEAEAAAGPHFAAAVQSAAADVPSVAHEVLPVGSPSNRGITNAAGMLGFLASAAMIEGADVLISNDSAPVHLASAMGTPVVEIYGATDASYGFSPYGVPHRLVQREDLDCRPCAIHGGNACPIGTFVCMRGLTADHVIRAAAELIGSRSQMTNDR